MKDLSIIQNLKNCQCDGTFTGYLMTVDSAEKQQFPKQQNYNSNNKLNLIKRGI